MFSSIPIVCSFLWIWFSVVPDDVDGDKEADRDTGLEDSPESEASVEECAVVGDDDGRAIRLPEAGLHLPGERLDFLLVEVVAIGVRPKHIDGHAGSDADEPDGEQLYLNHPEFDKAHILQMLEELQRTTHFAEHKPLVANMINFVKKFSDNQLVKNVKLKEANGKDFLLGKLKGKWTYLHFFRTDCLECVRELMVIREIQEMFKDSLRCVGVCLDFDKYQLQNFLNKYPQFDWEFVHFNQQYQWLDNLEVNSLPDYILLSPEGKIYERYLPAPTDGFVDYLNRLLSPTAPEDNNPMFHQRK